MSLSDEIILLMDLIYLNETSIKSDWQSRDPSRRLMLNNLIMSTFLTLSTALKREKMLISDEANKRSRERERRPQEGRERETMAESKAMDIGAGADDGDDDKVNSGE